MIFNLYTKYQNNMSKKEEEYDQDHLNEYYAMIWATAESRPSRQRIFGSNRWVLSREEK